MEDILWRNSPYACWGELISNSSKNRPPRNHQTIKNQFLLHGRRIDNDGVERTLRIRTVIEMKPHT